MYGNLLSWKKYFSEIFGDISWMFLHYFLMFTYFLYICQFFSWLTSLLKLGQYRYISWSGGVIFLNFFGDIPWILVALPLPFGQIWHGASLVTSFKIQEEPIRWTMLGPCLGHKRANFWLFLLYLCFNLFEMFKINTNIL